MPMASFTHSHNHRPALAAISRRPPYNVRRTATGLLAGRFDWREPQDLVSLPSDPSTPSPALSASATLAPAPSQPNNDNHALDPASTSRRAGAKAKGKAKLPPSRPVDMGVSIIPICAPGTGTPEPTSPPRPPPSYASSSSSFSFGVPPRSGFDMGASREDLEQAVAHVGKRSRGPSDSQRIRLPISPPVTSPYTSQSELPGVSASTAPDRTKRAREGREVVRRKRRKTLTTRGQDGTDVPAPAALGLHAEAAVRPPKPAREPTRRKGWKGWVMVSDTEGSDAERPSTPPVVILEKRTRSGREFEPEGPRIRRRARSTASARSATVDSVELSIAT